MALSILSTFFGFCTDFEIPAPPHQPPSNPTTPTVENSTVNIPVSVPLGEAFSKLDAAVPREDKKWDAWNFSDDWAYEYWFWRDPLNLALNGNRLSIGFHGYYRVRGGKKILGHVQVLGSCGDGEAPREVEAQVNTDLNWLPTWALSSNTQVAISYPNRCKIGLFDFDITGKINDIIEPKFRDAASQVDAKVGAIDLRTKVGEAWTRLQSPIQLADQIWLLIKPSKACVSPITGTGSTLTGAVGLIAVPAIVYGAQPAAGNLPLPNLAVTPPGAGFHVAIEGTIPFEDATKTLAKALVGRRYTYGGHYEQIDDAALYGTGDQLVLQLKLSGTLKGTIYLTGKPSFDTVRETFSIPDLDYSVDTKNIFVKLADWMDHEGFRNSLKAVCHWDAGDQIARAQTFLKNALNRQIGPHVLLSCPQLTVRPLGTYLTATDLKAQVVLDGSLSAAIN